MISRRKLWPPLRTHLIPKRKKKATINGKQPHQAWVHSCSSYFSDNGSHDPCTPPPPYPPRRCAASCPCHPLCHRLPPADAPAPLSLRSPCPPHDEWSASPRMSEPPAAAGDTRVAAFVSVRGACRWVWQCDWRFECAQRQVIGGYTRIWSLSLIFRVWSRFGVRNLNFFLLFVYLDASTCVLTISCCS